MVRIKKIQNRYIKKNKEGILLKCNSCGHTWMYKGNAYFFACCTKCLRKVKIPEKYKK